MARVLLVDDEEQILASLCRSLRREGYELVTARTPREALGILEEQDFDAVLTDYKMPGMTGVELLAVVARLQPNAGRLLITGWSQAVSEAEIEAFLASGFEAAHVLEVIVGIAMKTMSNFTNHVANVPLDPQFRAFEWQPASPLPEEPVTLAVG